MLTLLWLRDDLRTQDHEALLAACHDATESGGSVVALWLREAASTAVDGSPLGPRPLGAASRWWYHRSLEALTPRLADLGVPLVLGRGDARDIVPRVAAGLGATTVRWSRRYALGARTLDAEVKTRLTDAGVDPHSHPGHLLVEPWRVQTTSGGHYTVFTPFHRAAATLDVPPPLPAPAPLPEPDPRVQDALARLHGDGTLSTLDDLGLLDRRPAWWAGTVARHWTPGEESAAERLEDIGSWLAGYRTRHNMPGDADSTSRLSPHLRTGEVSPRRLLHAAGEADVPVDDRQAWVRQLYWREFCWHLTYHLPRLATEPLREPFRAFPYEPDNDLAEAWRRGRTGVDLVDAGMRQLWQSGWMHNRVRMVTASFFTKNLLQPWWDGEQWFWDTLVDADEANNAVSWQWVAGSGADAAPYFRVFNPDLQRDKFDPGGDYVRRWVSDADDRPLAAVVDLADSRRRALAAYQSVTS